MGKDAIGTTKKGVEPCYSTKASRAEVRGSEIFDKKTLARKLRTLTTRPKRRYGDLLQYDVDAEITRFDERREFLLGFLTDAVPFINGAQVVAEYKYTSRGSQRSNARH